MSRIAITNLISHDTEDEDENSQTETQVLIHTTDIPTLTPSPASVTLKPYSIVVPSNFFPIPGITKKKAELSEYSFGTNENDKVQHLCQN